jgi:hypothetical protein
LAPSNFARGKCSCDGIDHLKDKKDETRHEKP